MFYSDYHVHTNFSSDSTAEMTDMIEKAISLGLPKKSRASSRLCQMAEKNLPMRVKISVCGIAAPFPYHFATFKYRAYYNAKRFF